MIARLIGNGYWLVGWKLPLDLAAADVAVPRPLCFDLSKSNFVRKLVGLEPTTDCDPIPLSYVMHKITKGAIELRVQHDLDGSSRLLIRDVFNVAQIWSIVGAAEVEERMKKCFKLAYSSWYLGNGPCHDARLLIDNLGTFHREFELTPEFVLTAAKFLAPWARPIKPFEMCAWNSIQGIGGDGQVQEIEYNLGGVAMDAVQIVRVRNKLPALEALDWTAIAPLFKSLEDNYFHDRGGNVVMEISQNNLWARIAEQEETCSTDPLE